MLLYDHGDASETKGVPFAPTAPPRKNHPDQLEHCSISFGRACCEHAKELVCLCWKVDGSVVSARRYVWMLTKDRQRNKHSRNTLPVKVFGNTGDMHRKTKQSATKEKPHKHNTTKVLQDHPKQCEYLQS